MERGQALTGWRSWVRRVTPRSWRNWVRDPRASARWLELGWSWRRRGAAALDCGEGLVLRCHPASARTFRLFVDEPDSVAELADFRAELKPDARFFDLGAHYGFFTLAALALAGDDARVLAVEPSPAAFGVLGANLRLAPAGTRAQALHAAVGAADGQLAMLSGGVHSENYMFAANAAGRPDAVPVRQYSLAGLAQHGGWTPSLVKLDIEGFESEVLTAASGADNRETLRAWRPTLMLELHNGMLRERGREPLDVLHALAGAGYGAPRWQGLDVTPERALSAPVVRLCFTPAAAAHR